MHVQWGDHPLSCPTCAAWGWKGRSQESSANENGGRSQNEEDLLSAVLRNGDGDGYSGRITLPKLLRSPFVLLVIRLERIGYTILVEGFSPVAR